MTPTTFKEQNTTFALNQKEYYPLPVHKSMSAPTIITSCWKLTPLERLKLCFTSKIYVKIMTFGDPLQPQLLSTRFKDR